jgi:integrase
MGKRRGKGSGSVYQHKKKKKWVAQLVWIDPATGRKVRREKYCQTRREAEQALAEMVAAQAKGLLTDPSKLTVLDFALEYLRHLEKEGLRPNSIRLARDELAYAIPSLKQPEAYDPLGRMRLQEVKPIHVRAAVDRVMEAGYARRTVNRVLMRLKSLFREALHLELVARNPAESVRLKLGQEEKIGRALEPHEVARLLEAAEASRSKDMALLLRVILETGLRRGEALALQWRNIDLEAGELTVERAWVKVRGKGAFSEPKTRAARRKVPLSQSLLHRLKERREELLEYLTPEEVDGLFLVGGVKPVDPDAFNHYLRRLTQKAGLGRVRVHDLRHTWATLALSRGIPLEVVSERLGHASPTITLNVYRHLLEEERRGYVLDLEELLRPAVRPVA